MTATWALAAVLPLPVLVVTDPASSGDIACLYLGLAVAWLVVEFHRTCGRPWSAASWRVRMLAVVIAIAVNVGLFIAFGLSAGVQTHFPFPLMAALSAVPGVGIVPWMLRRTSQPYVAVIFAAILVLAAKLAACVVARIVYGPDYIEKGYVSADWRTAKLMISVFWSFSTALSLLFLLAEYRICSDLPPFFGPLAMRV